MALSIASQTIWRELGAEQQKADDVGCRETSGRRIALEAARQRQAAEEFRSATFVVGTLLGFIDRRAGAIVSGIGPALLQAHSGLQSLALKGFSFAATGDILSAGLAVQSLLAGDPATERHKQVMQTLQAIIERLDFIIDKLNVIEEHVVAIRKDLRTLLFETGVNATDAKARLIRLESGLRDYFDYSSTGSQEKSDLEIADRERSCNDQD